MHDCRIDRFSVGSSNENPTITGVLDRPPPQPWVEAFHEATEPEIFGRRVELDGQTVTLHAQPGRLSTDRFTLEAVIGLVNGIARGAQPAA